MPEDIERISTQNHRYQRNSTADEGFTQRNKQPRVISAGIRYHDKHFLRAFVSLTNTYALVKVWNKLHFKRISKIIGPVVCTEFLKENDTSRYKRPLWLFWTGQKMFRQKADAKCISGALTSSACFGSSNNNLAWTRIVQARLKAWNSGCGLLRLPAGNYCSFAMRHNQISLTSAQEKWSRQARWSQSKFSIQPRYFYCNLVPRLASSDPQEKGLADKKDIIRFPGKTLWCCL